MILIVVLLSFVIFWACLAAVFGASVPLSAVVGLGAVPVSALVVFIVALIVEYRRNARRARQRAATRRRRGF